MLNGIFNMTKKNRKDKLFEILARNKVILFGDYVCSENGLRDTKYLDMNRLISDPIGINYVTKKLALLCKNEVNSNTAVLGLAHTGIPYASLVAQHLGLSLGYVRKERKNYGTKKIIEGNFPPKTKVIVVDDIIADPSETLPFLSNIKQEALEIEALVVIVEKLPEETSRKVFENKGYKVLSLLQYKDYLKLESIVRNEKK